MSDNVHNSDLLAPDLDWLITSTQVGNAQVASFLIKYYLNRVYLFALLLVGEPSTAYKLAYEALLRTMENRHNFPGNQSAEIWIYTLLLSEHLQIKWFKTFNLRKTIFFEPPKMEESVRTVFYKLNELTLYEKLRIFFVDLCDLNEKDVLSILDQFDDSRGTHNIGRRIENSHPRRTESESEKLINLKTWLWSAFPSDKVNESTGLLTKILNERRISRNRTLGITQTGLIMFALLFMVLLGNILPFDEFQQKQNPPTIITVLATRLVYITTTPLPPPTSTPFPQNATLLLAREGEKLGELADRAWAEVGFLAKLNGLEPNSVLEEGQQIMVGSSGKPLTELLPTLVPDSDQGVVLNSESPINEIIFRLANTYLHWFTIHLEGLIYTYSQPGFISPPKITRSWLWSNGPRYSLILEGETTGEINLAMRNENDRLYIQNYNIQQRKVDFYFGMAHADLGLLVYPPVKVLTAHERQSFSAVGSDTVAGRDTVIVEWLAEENGSIPKYSTPLLFSAHRYLQRWWIDADTGIILRRQIYWDSNGHYLKQEIMVTNIEVDSDLPNRLFDHLQPLPQNFNDDFLTQDTAVIAADPFVTSGIIERAPVPSELVPPAGFDPAVGDLTFEWQTLVESGNQLSLPADIYSDGYFLGTAKIGNPMTLACRRSPDGSKVAFSNGRIDTGVAGLPLRWFDIHDPARIQTVLPNVYPYDWAFSSTGRYLAIYGCTFNYECRIYVADLETGTTEPLVYFSNAASLVWLTDDETLAFIGAHFKGDQLRAYQVNVKTAELESGFINSTISSMQDERIIFPRPSEQWGWLLYQPCTSKFPNWESAAVNPNEP